MAAPRCLERARERRAVLVRPLAMDLRLGLRLATALPVDMELLAVMRLRVVMARPMVTRLLGVTARQRHQVSSVRHPRVIVDRLAMHRVAMELPSLIRLLAATHHPTVTAFPAATERRACRAPSLRHRPDMVLVTVILLQVAPMVPQTAPWFRRLERGIHRRTVIHPSGPLRAREALAVGISVQT